MLINHKNFHFTKISDKTNDVIFLKSIAQKVGSKSIPSSQALRLNIIYSNNAFFDQRCNELEHWLHECGYSEIVFRQEILKARRIPRNELLEKESNHQENKLMFNTTYYPAFQNNFGRITDSNSARASENVS